jgi:16S rRNA (guanine966-N2)-methyltransferase
VFLDPPYDRDAEYAPVLKLLSENPPKLVIVQHSVRFDLAESYGALQRTRTLKQGDNMLSFYAAV